MLHSALVGRAELRHVQEILLKAGVELDRRLLAETRAALRPTQKEVKASTARLPSGYAPIMARAVRVITRTTAGSNGVRATVRVTARGRGQKRYTSTIDAGILRHPLFGRRVDFRTRSGKLVKAWYDQPVKPRFVADPLAAMAKRVNDGAEKAADELADHILRG